MSLETVVEDIREAAEREAAEIRAAAEEEADDIVSAAERDARETFKAAEREIEQRIEREREQRLSSAALEAKQERLGARRDVLDDVYDRVADRIASLSEERREVLIRELLDSSVDEFEDATVRVHGRPDDQAILEQIVEDYPSFELGEEIECLGGVILESEASRVRVNNTFDAILDEVWETNLKGISDRLFEQ